VSAARFLSEVPAWGSEWRWVEAGAHTPAPLHTLSARASVTTPATTNPSAPAASYSCQLTVSVSDSSPPSVGASARGDDTRGGGGEGCGGAAAAAAPSSRVASLRAGSRCCQTTPPHALSSLRIRCCEKTVCLTSLLMFRTVDSPELTLPCTTTGTRAAPWALCRVVSTIGVAHTRRGRQERT
jgi:hypothetical protein